MAKLEVSSNPLQIEWPQDTFRITQKFKSEGLRLAGRVAGQRDKLEVALATIDVVRAHLIARYKDKVVTDKAVIAEAQARAKEARKNAERQRQEQVRALQEELDRLEAEADTEAATDVEAGAAREAE